MKDNALVAPKLNNLYNQKSKHIVDKLKRMFEVNLISIVVGALLILVVSIFLEAFLAGAALCLQLLLLVFLGKKELNDLNQIDKGASSYDYLKAFDSWIKKVISTYTKVYRVLYPGMFLTFVIGFWFSSVAGPMREAFMMRFPDSGMLLGMPVPGVIGALVFAGLLALFAGKLYQLDMNIVYGREFNKLDDIIADMETLRA